MALKKSDLYSSIWASCDELRGGMDASQYKDYVLFMLFIKYVSDKYADYDGFEPPIVIPKGASFKDMVALKGDANIGDKINTQIIQSLIDANTRLARSDFPDFNDPNKLGDGQARVERLGNLIAIFQNPALDFSQNRAEHDDILGDAYEYLMRHFATQSGKSKASSTLRRKSVESSPRCWGFHPRTRSPRPPHTIRPAAPARCCCASPPRPGSTSPWKDRRRTARLPVSPA